MLTGVNWWQRVILTACLISLWTYLDIAVAGGEDINVCVQLTTRLATSLRSLTAVVAAGLLLNTLYACASAACTYLFAEDSITGTDGVTDIEDTETGDTKTILTWHDFAKERPGPSLCLFSNGTSYLAGRFSAEDELIRCDDGHAEDSNLVRVWAFLPGHDEIDKTRKDAVSEARNGTENEQ